MEEERGAFSSGLTNMMRGSASPLCPKPCVLHTHTHTQLQRPGPCHSNLANHNNVVNEEWQRPSDENHI